MKKIIYLSCFLLLTFNLYATSTNNEVPEESGTKFYDSNSVTNTDGLIGLTDSAKNNKELISDDTLPNQNINRGLFYTENLGVATGDNVINSDGSNVYLKRNADGTRNTEITEDNVVKQQPKGESFSNYNTYYENYVMKKTLEEKIAADREAEDKARTEVFSSGNTVADTSNRFLNSKNISSGSGTVVNNMRINTMNENLTNADLLQREKDATKLYSENYSLDPSAANVDNIKNTNYGALTKAFQSLDTIKESLTNRLTKETVKCQISRQLLPSYRCPIESKAGILYPSGANINDIRKVNVQVAEKECNDNCWTDPGELSCLNKKILDTDVLNTDSFSELTLYPNWNQENSIKIFETTQAMPVEYVKVKFEIKNDTNASNMTDEEWEQFLYTTNFKVRVSILETNNSLNGDLDVEIVDRMVVSLKSSIMEIDIPVTRILNGLKIKFWEPYISDNILNKPKDLEIFNKLVNDYNSSIKVLSIKAKYSSDSYYFCQAKQMVSHPNECIGGTVEEFVTGDDQFNYLCNSNSRKIGPEPTWGGFYSQDACERNCVIQKPCETTYNHYNSYGDNQFMFKTEFTCVDDPDNSSCTVEICKTLFSNPDDMPLNEIVTLNDDTQVYTVKNRILQKTRPKIDLEMEMSSSIDYDLLFQEEEKDAAYLYMLNNLTFNRIAYRLGTESPFNMAYIKEYAGGKTSIGVKLKPASFDIDSNKDFYMYSILKLEHSYKPVAGAWYVSQDGGINADPNNSNIQFKDVTYAIKTTDDTNPWQTFRREEFAKILTNVVTTTLNEDGTVETSEHWDWIDSNQYKIVSFGNYDNVTDNFNLIDKNQLAISFYTDKFKSDKEYYTYQISSFIEKDLVDSKGLLIKSQQAINHDTSFRKLYNVPENSDLESWPKNYTLYFVYSDVKLSYNDLMKKIEGDNYETDKELSVNNKYAFYELMNPSMFRSDEIKYDGEINNNIKTLIKSTADKSTVFVDWEPSISEKGKKMFKFLFLYDDTEKDIFEYQ